VRSQGRFEIFERPAAAPMVLDGAHNPEGCRALVQGLSEAFPGRRILAVVGALRDKDVKGILGVLLDLADGAVLTRVPNQRAATLEELETVARGFGNDILTAPGVALALALADELTGPEDVVVVTGSLYLVGAARDHLGGEVR
jgi:dihydrofolate synthase/folylpolyglutamate synthase